MTEREFPIDVAFSFLADDEPVAARLASMLGARYQTFVYSDHQKDLAGRDGEEEFADVFGVKARVVVILYRPEWGTTRWTRIEQTAIKNRALDDGYDFTLWVPMAEITKFPPWFPRTRLYYNLSRFGDTGLSAVIDQLFQQQGGNSRPETLQDRAQRMDKERKLAAARQELIEGNDRASCDKVKLSASAISDAVADWAKGEPILKADVKRTGDVTTVVSIDRGRGAPLCLLVSWDPAYLNQIGSAARFSAETFEGHPPWPGYWTRSEAVRRRALRFKPSLNAAFEPCWIDGSGNELTAAAAADRICRFLMDEMVSISCK